MKGMDCSHTKMIIDVLITLVPLQGPSCSLREYRSTTVFRKWTNKPRGEGLKFDEWLSLKSSTPVPRTGGPLASRDRPGCHVLEHKPESWGGEERTAAVSSGIVPRRVTCSRGAVARSCLAGAAVTVH